VAGLASRAHLTLVNVGVAVGAFGADIAENHLGVTGCASYAFVHSSQRIPGLVVVELRYSANRLPSVNSVAVLASNVQIAMRTVRTLRRLGRALPQ
jgi:hypothetical protein